MNYLKMVLISDPRVRYSALNVANHWECWFFIRYGSLSTFLHYSEVLKNKKVTTVEYSSVVIEPGVAFTSKLTHAIKIDTENESGGKWKQNA